MNEWVYIGVGATAAASLKAVFGSTVKHLDRVGKEVEALRRRSARAGVPRTRGDEPLIHYSPSYPGVSSPHTRG